MKIVIVFNHPYEGSFCNAILNAVTNGLTKGHHEVDLIHLDKDGFNPVMTAADLKGFRDKKPNDPKVIEYANKIEEADHLIFIFPIWWELMPALTKGFIDKVIFPGVAYDYTNASNTRMKPLWEKLKGITIITTMNTPKWLYLILFGNAIKKAIILGTFWKIGFKNRKWISFNQVKMVSAEQRERWLTELDNKFTNLIS
ncbi:NAD(P)H-dependent oxidoreductase [Pedobacter lithocola]|uniref:NAD(P)H-dependent oxidoreductase n=1 Tax=Pedobacter lithocola TaxID=1908239 RepID=A0ABV8PHP3_9SPHI